MPKPLQNLAQERLQFSLRIDDFVHFGFIDRAMLVQPSGDLVDVAAHLSHQADCLMNFLQIQLQQVPVQHHRPEVSGSVPDAEGFHFLPDGGILLRRDFEAVSECFCFVFSMIVFLCLQGIDDLFPYDFFRSAADAVHPADPFHLVYRL